MKFALDLKEKKKSELSELEKLENQKYVAYIKEMDKREEVMKQAREEKEIVKNKIFEKLKQEEEKRKKD